MWTDAERLVMLKAVGAEQFETGHPDPLWAVFEGDFFVSELDVEQELEGEQLWLECRLSDIAEHELIQGSSLTRISDGQEFIMARHEPNRGAGFTVVRLREV